MQLYRKLIAILFIVTSAIASCTKGVRNEEQFFYGEVEISLAAFPNTPDMDVYIDNDNMGVIMPGSGPAMGRAQTSEKIKISLFKKGTKDLVADTLIQLFKDSTIYLKAAYSEPMGVSGFLGKGASVHPDSCTFQLFNNLPATILPDEVEVDAVLCEDDATGQTIELGIVWENLKKGKLHPLPVTVPVRDYYVLKFRNRATGEFLLDSFGRDKALMYVTPGKYLIITASSRLLFNRPTFNVESAEI